MAWRSLGLLDATKSPFMLVLDVAAVAAAASISEAAGGGLYLHEASRMNQSRTDADMSLSIAESMKAAGLGHTDQVCNLPFTVHPVLVI